MAKKDLQVVYFDLETTDLVDPDIVQIAACYKGQEFNAYLVPTLPINPDASKVTGLTVADGELFLRGHRVATVSAEDAFREFLEFLKNIGKPVVLVAHNCHKFDAPILVKYFKRVHLLNNFKKVIHGFADSLKILRKKLKIRMMQRESFRLVDLAREFVKDSNFDGAHDAIQDTMMLEKVLNAVNVSHAEMTKGVKKVLTFT